MATDTASPVAHEKSVIIASSVATNAKVLVDYHSCYELAYFEHAELRVFCHDRWYDVQDNMLMWVPEYQLHRIEYHESEMYSRTVLQVQSAFLLDAIHSMGVEALFNEMNLLRFRLLHLTQEQGKRVKILLEVCSENYAAYLKNPSAGNVGILKASILTLLSQVFALHEKDENRLTQVSQNYIRILTQYIDAHFNDSITLDTLAEMIHVDKHYLCRVFKKQMHMTVVQYVQYRRVLEAQKRLLFTDMPINVIAAECGFNSLQHFYKVFHEISGYTPGDYHGMNGRKHNVN